MHSYIVLLRGINVSGTKKIRMAELRESLDRVGFQDVSTYIQSGNVTLRYAGSIEEVNTRVNACIRNDFGHDVPVLSFTPEDLHQLHSACPYHHVSAAEKNLYFVFLFDQPSAIGIRALEQESFPNEAFQINPQCIYLNCKNGYGKAKCNNNFFEKRLQVRATTRNFRTVETLMKMGAEID